MPELEEFQCPNCGANVDPPKPGQTIECPYCSAKLTEPEAPEKVVVREIVHERVVERVEPAAPAPNFRRSTLSKKTRIYVALGVVAVTLLAIAMIASSDQEQIDRLHAQEKAQDECEQTCKKRCEKQYKAALPTPADSATIDPNHVVDDQMKELEAESAKTTCDLNCTQHCM